MSVMPVTRIAMVAPPRSVVVIGVASFRAEPDDSAELVDQAHYGEHVTRLAERGDWYFAQGLDLYLGWIRAADVRAFTSQTPVQRIVAVPLAPVRSRPAVDGAVIDELPAGSVLVRHPAAGDWLEVGDDRYVRLDDTVETTSLPQRYPMGDDLVATAGSFVGAPYLWGGTSAHGIDCSGLTQQVYRLNGVGLARDADQQALGGRPVGRARPGDLFFFGAERVTHTGIATGETTFIHAPQAGQHVQPGELGPDRSRLRAIRRYLP